MDFFVYNTTTKSKGKNYDLSDPVDKVKYFHSKASKEIDFIKQFLDTNSFLGITLSKKGAGKGTYIKMFTEVIGEDRVTHVSVGDVIREFQDLLLEKDSEVKQEYLAYIKSNYRGFEPLEKQLKAISVKQQQNLFSDELVLSLIKYKLSKTSRGAVFLDGYPRNIDQVSYSLYIRDLMRFKEDPDFFIILDVPESLIELRIKSRRICPICHTSRNPITHLSKFVVAKGNNVVLLCDNPGCEGFGKEVMVEKVGDSDGLAPIRARLDLEGAVIEKALKIHGVEKVLCKGTVPISILKNGEVEDFELTPRSNFEIKGAKVVNKPTPLIIDHEVDGKSYSLLPPAVVLNMISQIYSILSTGKNKYLI